MINPQTFQLPEQLSTGAAEVDDLYMIVFWFSVVFTAIIAFCIVYFAWEYRRRPGVKSAPVGHMLTLELAWTIIPLVLVVIPFHYGFKVYVHNAVAAEGATEIRVRGEKWKWNFQYPNGMRENGLLRIPVGKPVKFVISSEDVLHSFYVPGARLKKDAVPGMYSTISFTPIKLGDMQVFCAEYCGTSHSGMLATIRVVTNEEYEKFLKEGAGPEAGELPAAWGARLYKQNSCNTCHSTDGAKMPGPTWKGIWHRDEAMSDGTKLTIDENYIKESITKPQAKIVGGYTTVVMPPFVFNDKQIDAIIAYMKTL
ncbi:MAG: cytochrome c oxidase subunit II [Polyangiaceae bacterium]